MDISVLISTYKRPAILAKTLSSFQEICTNNLCWQALVANNADDPETQNVLKPFQNKLPLEFIVVPQPGKNAALNRLVELAQGRLIVFTDDDVTPDENWLLDLWQASQRWPDDILSGVKVIPVFPPNTPEWIRNPKFEYAPAAFARFDKGEGERPFEDFYKEF